jgi:FMN phosphatase YigB (HAD superfamily)
VTELDLGRLSTSEFFRRAEAAAGLAPLPDDVWIPAWRDIFVPFPEALAVLGRVRPDVPKILVSNTNALHWEGVLRVADVRRLVDGCVLSFREGRAKPDPAFFAAALAEAGVRASEAVFADDHLEYVDAARRLGLDAFAVESPGQFADALSARGLLEPL